MQALNNCDRVCKYRTVAECTDCVFANITYKSTDDRLIDLKHVLHILSDKAVLTMLGCASILLVYQIGLVVLNWFVEHRQCMYYWFSIPPVQG